MQIPPKQKIIIGLQLLRVICCFGVIITHFYKFYNIKFLYNKHDYYLRIFFFTAFYFSYSSLSSKNIGRIKERFKRMVIPYIGWPLIIYITDKVNHYLYNVRESYSIKNFYYQILIGCGIYGILWFVFNLIFLSVIFVLIILLFKKRYIFVMLIICIFIYSVYYSNYANIFLSEYKLVPVHHSIKPIAQYFVFVFSGYYFAYIKILNKLHKYRILSILCSSLLIIIYFKYYFLFSVNVPLSYKGLVDNIFTLELFIFFAMIPFDKINNKHLYNVLIKMTNYTGGVYYLHVIIDNFLKKYVEANRQRTFIGCLFNYLVSYYICLSGVFIFNQNSLKYLFI
jgi:hypothetical protein